jgi:RNA polymerase sigma-70 factor (ECF subfamily)
MGPPSFPALQRAHGMDRKARNRRELLLREARSLAERFELRAKGPRSATFHGAFILLQRLYGRRTSPVRVLSVVACPRARHIGHMTGDLPRSATASRKTSDRSVRGELCRPATAPAIGESFDEVVLPHLDAAYRLACWLMRNVHDAEDAVQEASLRAFRYFRTYTGGNGRAWLLRIVRNTCCGWRGHSSRAPSEPFDEERHSDDRPACDPETLALQAEDARLIEQAMRSLPVRSRELLVLRELEGLSYRELAAVLGIPIGTVMSSLSRARQAFRRAMARRPVDDHGVSRASE